MNRFLARPTLGPEARAAAIGALRFIAFAYTYHYLNWFSKTGIIHWQVVSQRRIAGLVALWLVSLALYAWSWQWGYVGLLGLSVAHVILGFWEVDPRTEGVVWHTFEPAPKAIAKQLDEQTADVAAFMFGELGHAKAFTLDTMELVQRRADRIAKLRSAKKRA
jgi:hypothetical protein